MRPAGSADLGCAAEEEQLGEVPCNAGAAGEEPRDPNLGVIRFKAHKLMGAQPHGSQGLPGCHSLHAFLCAKEMFVLAPKQMRTVTCTVLLRSMKERLGSMVGTLSHITDIPTRTECDQQ